MFPLNPFDYLRVTMQAAQIMAEWDRLIDGAAPRRGYARRAASTASS